MLAVLAEADTRHPAPPIDGRFELRCPQRSSVIGAARCLEYQAETGCSCQSATTVKPEELARLRKGGAEERRCRPVHFGMTPARRARVARIVNMRRGGFSVVAIAHREKLSVGTVQQILIEGAGRY